MPISLVVIDSDGHWTLPPLILHPFSEPAAPRKVMESSHASLVLEGLLPQEELSLGDLERNLLEGRYCEFSMLFYVGKDVLRWAGQCTEVIERTSDLRHTGIRRESFVRLLVKDPPAKVDRKLRAWGVHEYPSIFARAVGLQTAFQSLPPRHVLAPEFVRHYHRFADQIFACGLGLYRFTEIRSANFDFELYASSEYTKLLEKQWNADDHNN